jgi:hypothetical protein
MNASEKEKMEQKEEKRLASSAKLFTTKLS